MGDWTRVILFVVLCHVLSRRFIGQLLTVRGLLSDILGVVPKRLFVNGLM